MTAWIDVHGRRKTSMFLREVPLGKRKQWREAQLA